MSELDVSNYRVCIEPYSHDRHFNKVFCLACEYLSSFRIYPSGSFYFNPPSTCKRSSANSCASCPRSHAAKSTCLKLCQQCYFNEHSKALILKAKHLTAELVHELIQSDHPSYEPEALHQFIEVHMGELYKDAPLPSGQIARPLMVDMLAHIISLMTNGTCLIAMLEPLNGIAARALDGHSNSSIAGVLHYETGNYTKPFSIYPATPNAATAACTVGGAVGAIDVGRYCYISKVYVRPICRRQGIASELIGAAGDYTVRERLTYECAVHQGAKTLVFLDTIKTFAPAISLYESLSFKNLPESLLPKSFKYEPGKMYLYNLR